MGNKHLFVGEDKTIFIGDNDNNSVFSVNNEDGKIVFEECCDNWYSVSMTKEEAIEMLEELKIYIQNEL